MSQDELFEITPDVAAVLQHAPDPELRRRWPRSLAALFDVADAALRDQGMDPRESEAMAARVVMALSLYHGGHHFYLPRGKSLEKAIRDRIIHNRWQRGGFSVDEAAAEYGMTPTRILQIIKEQSVLWRERHQPKLL